MAPYTLIRATLKNPKSIDINEYLPRASDAERLPANSPRWMTRIAPVRRYWYHSPRRKRGLLGMGSLKAYPIREKEAASSFGKGYKDTEYIWMSWYPFSIYGGFIIDITRLKNENLRFTGQSEGHMLHRGDIPASAIVGKVHPHRS